jgi:hypothetical protein
MGYVYYYYKICPLSSICFELMRLSSHASFNTPVVLQKEGKKDEKEAKKQAYCRPDHFPKSDHT